MCTPAELARAPEGGSSYPRGVAPELHPLDEDIKQEAIDEARATVCTRSFRGASYCRAVLYYAAHLLTVRYPRLAAGSAAAGTGTGLAHGLTSVKTGEESYTGGAGASADDLSSTKYGRTYAQMLKNAGGGPRWYR